MKINRVLDRKKEDVEKRKEDASQAISIMTNKSIQINFDYSKLHNVNEEEKNKLMEIEKELIFEGKKLGTIAIEIGKKLLEAREVFIKSHNESFIEWYEQLGFNKDQVSIFIKRYQMSVEFPTQKEQIINFSDRMIIQLNKKNTTKEIIEKVLNGEIKTPKEIIENRKNISSMLEIFSDEIEEAEVIEDYNALMVKELEEIMEVLSKIEKNSSRSKDNLNVLIRIKKILNGME
ncbi:MAG: hypothetical protein KBE24_07945 [Fusobacteriaceae bacterium]|nr:hypothetical protein [Fusobacteriaceae bacterium]